MNIIGTPTPKKAEYVVSGLEEYDDNPCIAALPPLIDQETAMQLLYNVPICPEELRGAPPETRLHALNRLGQVVIPLSNNLTVFNKLSRVMRDAYLLRNINDPGFFSWKNQIVQLFSEADGNWERLCPTAPIDASTHPKCLYVNGPPGGGKTFAILRILAKVYSTRVIQHINLQGSFTQIPYLFVECSHLGSAKRVVEDMIGQIAILTGQKPELLCPKLNKNVSADALIPELVNLLLMYSVGTVFIDEVEAIKSAHSGGDRAFMQFFVSLVNQAYTPFVLTANPDVDDRFKSQLKWLIRMSGAGAMKFDYLPGDSKDWELMITQLWKVQYTKIPTPLTPELAQVMHEKSQGILKLLNYLFDWTQAAAIQVGGDERITPRLIEHAFAENAMLVEEIIKGLAAGDHKIAEDTNSAWLDDTPTKSQTSSTQTRPIQTHQPSAKVPALANDSAVPPPSEPSRTSKKKYRPFRLVSYASDQRTKKGRTSYEALQRDGWTVSTAEFAC